MKEAIRAHAQSLGFDLVGFTPAVPISAAHDYYRGWIEAGFDADMGYLSEHVFAKSDPNHLLEGAQTIIAVGLNYNQANDPKPGHPKISRYAAGRDYHKVVHAKLKKLSKFVESAFPDASSRICVDSTPILERSYAHIAGLGWFGKNTMLINSKRGSWFFIGILITTARLEPDAPAEGGCGTCTKCIDACPTGAIVFHQGRWAVNSSRCISYLTIENRSEIPPDLAAHLDGWTFGCDICQEVCPFNQPRESQPLRAATTTEPDFLKSRSWPTLIQLAQISEPDWDRLTQGSPVRRAGLVGIQRNAKANLDA